MRKLQEVPDKCLTILHNIINIHGYDFTFMTEVPFHDFGKVIHCIICFFRMSFEEFYLINSTLFPIMEDLIRMLTLCFFLFIMPLGNNNGTRHSTLISYTS